MYSIRTIFVEGGMRLSSFALRLLALVCMMVDHAGLAIFPSTGLFRCIGRLALPLYCFLLVQGYIHTRDVRAYARRLLLLAIVSEIPFDLLIFARMASGAEQNILFSLLLALLSLVIADTHRGKALPCALMEMGLCLVAMAARVSFGWLPIALCLSFYYGMTSRPKGVLLAACSLLLYTAMLWLSGVAQSWVLVSLCAPLGLVPVLFYNGKRGPASPVLKLMFYAAYPLHIVLLLVLRGMRIFPPYFLH